ncbi:hypothetical protein ACJIZ3_000882 [Penstemon smallii]|uniref:Uncharacterized protein n=1 Tax=Penstemon smallii TaxID=265156 RepID=A0ABD3U202_9LAMI
MKAKAREAAEKRALELGEEPVSQCFFICGNSCTELQRGPAFISDLQSL